MVDSKINSMQHKDLLKAFSQYLVDRDFQKIESSFSYGPDLSRAEYFLNLSKIAQDSGDSWASFAFFLKAFVENYFVKYLGVFKKHLYNIEAIDSLSQVMLVIKTEFALFMVLTLFFVLFVRSQRHVNKIKNSLIISFISFFVLTVLLTNNIKLGLLKPQTTKLNSPSKVFPSGEVSGEKDLFLIIGGDEVFLKMIDARLKSFWVRKEDAIVFK